MYYVNTKIPRNYYTAVVEKLKKNVRRETGEQIFRIVQDDCAVEDSTITGRCKSQCFVCKQPNGVRRFYQEAQGQR